MKRLCADDSDLTVVKVGHRQAPSPKPPARVVPGVLFFRTLISGDQELSEISRADYFPGRLAAVMTRAAAAAAAIQKSRG